MHCQSRIKYNPALPLEQRISHLIEIFPDTAVDSKASYYDACHLVVGGWWLVVGGWWLVVGV